MGAPLGQWEQGGGECKPVGDGSAEAATTTVSGELVRLLLDVCWDRIVGRGKVSH